MRLPFKSSAEHGRARDSLLEDSRQAQAQRRQDERRRQQQPAADIQLEVKTAAGGRDERLVSTSSGSSSSLACQTLKTNDQLNF